MRPRSILIISYYFPPANMVAALRVYSFARYLSEYGYRVSVLCNDMSNLGTDTSLNLDCSMFKTIAVRSNIASLKNIDYYNQKALKSDHWLQKISWKVKNAAIRMFARIKNRLIGNLLTPEDFWLVTAWLKARLLDDAEKFDVVVTSSGPISCHILGYGLKRNRNEIVWIADYRDPWLNNPNFAQPVWPINRLQVIIQKRLNDLSDALISVSELLMKDFFPEYILKGCLIENGFFLDDMFGEQTVNPDKFVITYTGTYYDSSYSCEELFEGINIFVEQGLVDGRVMEINFFGSNSSSIVNEAKKYGVADFVAIHPKVSRSESLAFQRASNVLVFFSSRDPLYRGFYSSKLFEYLASGVPILVVGNNVDNCAATLVADAGAGFVCGTDSNKVFDALNKIQQGEIPYRNEIIINNFRRDLLANRLIDLVERLCHS